MVVITKHKDGSYSVSNGTELVNDQTALSAIVKCFWEYGIRRDMLETALNTLNRYNDDMILFFNDTEYTTKKIDYTQVYKSQEN